MQLHSHCQRTENLSVRVGGGGGGGKYPADRYDSYFYELCPHLSICLPFNNSLQAVTQQWRTVPYHALCIICRVTKIDLDKHTDCLFDTRILRSYSKRAERRNVRIYWKETFILDIKLENTRNTLPSRASTSWIIFKQKYKTTIIQFYVRGHNYRILNPQSKTKTLTVPWVI